MKIVSCDCDVGKQNEKRREEERRGTKWKGKEEHNGNDEKIEPVVHAPLVTERKGGKKMIKCAPILVSDEKYRLDTW
jgi:hypothetical protein